MQNDNKQKKQNTVSNSQILREIEALNNSVPQNKDEVLHELENKDYVKKLRPVEMASQMHKNSQKGLNKIDTSDCTNIYSGAELDNEKKSKLKLLIFWFITFAIYIAATVTLMVLFDRLPYGTNSEIWYKVGIIALTVVFACYTFAFFSLKYSRFYRYVKLLKGIQGGIKESAEGVVMGVDKAISIYDGVEFYSIKLSVYNEYKQGNFERKLYFDKQKIMPNFKVGDKLTILALGNIMLAYKIQ